MIAVLLWGCAYLTYDYLTTRGLNNTTNAVRESYYSALAQGSETNAEAPADPMNGTAQVNESDLVVEDDGLFSMDELLASESKQNDATVNNTNKENITVVGESLMQEQFAKLYEQNPDLVGWLKVNDDVEYPMVWRDNQFYMDHDYNGRYNAGGWIFLDERNATDMSDDSLLIYGHNMKYGEMFGELDEYLNKDHLRANPIVEIQPIWSKEKREYVVFALVDASMNPDHSTYIKITEFNFDTDEAMNEYIRMLQEASVYDIPIDTQAGDQLILLVTCSYEVPNGRLILCARQLREDESADEIRAMFSGK
ncbi:MAG: class B sortase [Eubacteriales bacterium]|nr:class B sortase [Eubacteriales bacterium]